MDKYNRLFLEFSVFLAAEAKIKYYPMWSYKHGEEIFKIVLNRRVKGQEGR